MWVKPTYIIDMCSTLNSVDPSNLNLRLGLDVLHLDLLGHAVVRDGQEVGSIGRIINAEWFGATWANRIKEYQVGITRE